MSPFAIESTTIDGVPVFWADVPVPRTAALQFGVGRALEGAAMGGISHLVEHLALAPLTQQEYSHNGFVASGRTVFHATGSDAELVDYFGRVCENLTRLPADRLLVERRILRTESHDHSPGIGGQMLWYRFGHRGYGLVAAQELGLGWLGTGRVQDWSDTMFTRGNAVLWISGPPPADLRLPLPEGSRRPSMPVEPIADLRFPAHMAWSSRGVAMSYLTSRSAASVTTLEQVARRAREVLRFQRGVVYDLKSDYEPLDGTTAHCLLAADCEPDHAPLVAAEVVRAFDDIAASGLTDDEIRRVIRNHREGWELPQSHLGMLDGAAFGQLMGKPYDAPADILAEYEALDAATTAKTLADARGTLLLASAGSPPSGHDWVPYPIWSPGAVTGRTVGPPGLAFLRRDKRKDRLTVGPDGVTWHSGDGGHLTVRYTDCVAYRHWDGDVRELWGADGFSVHVAANAWRDGTALVAEIDAAVAPEVVACSEHGIGALEDTGDPIPGAPPALSGEPLAGIAGVSPAENREPGT